MKKILLLGVLLFMAVPAMAASNVTLSYSVDGNEVTVSYATDANKIRAFGLDIDITSGDATITKAEMVSTDYRIFPGQIVIADGAVTDYGTPYDPCDLGDANLTVEMGSLYAADDPCKQTAPPDSGQLFKFWVTCGSGESQFAVTENTLRGGVVMEDPYEDPVVTTISDANVCEPSADMEFGDAPDTYSTLIASNGARHTGTGPMLGAARDLEPDGQPSPLCDLDDLTGVPDDEDGVTLIIAKDPTGSATVTVSAACLLDAFMDFNGDGDFADAGEQILSSYVLSAGANVVTFPIPAGARQSTLVSRWRVSTAGGLSYDGAAADGEVEDYITECLDPTDPGYAAWISVTWNRPRCWCYRRQCRGDVDGLKAGPFWVQVNDLNTFKLAFNKADAALALVANGICADFDHLKAGPFRVNVNDLNILKAYFNKAEAAVPPCDSAPIITGPYNFWTNSPN